MNLRFAVTSKHTGSVPICLNRKSKIALRLNRNRYSTCNSQQQKKHIASLWHFFSQYNVLDKMFDRKSHVFNTQGYRYHKLRKTFGKFFRSYSELLSKFGDISFHEYLSKGISHPVIYGDLVYKLRRVKDTPNFILSGSKIVKRLRRRQYDPVIIEMTIGLVLGPSTALYEPFLKHCTLTNKAVGTIWRVLSKPPQRRQGPDLCPLWLLVGTPSAIRPELAYSRAEHSRPYLDVAKYIFDI